MHFISAVTCTNVDIAEIGNHGEIKKKKGLCGCAQEVRLSLTY